MFFQPIGAGFFMVMVIGLVMGVVPVKVMPVVMVAPLG
jgi:hypothetical protein